MTQVLDGRSATTRRQELVTPPAHGDASGDTVALMYRTEDSDPALRFERARGRLETLARALENKRQRAQLLSAQIVRGGGALVPVPALPKTDVAVGDAASMPPAALAGITAEIERATLELESHEARLDAMIAEFQARLDGGSVVATLGPPPRGVPFVYWLAEWLSLPFILVLAIGGSVVFFLGQLLEPLRFAPAAFALGVIVWSLVATMQRTRLLGRGSLPVSTSTTEKPGFGSYLNQRLTSYRGWEAVATQYSGPRVKTHVRFVASDGSAGELVVGGMPYKGGIILCAPGGGAGSTSRGMTVGRFRSHPRPDARGQWQPSIGGAQWAGVAIGALLLVASLGAAGYSAFEGGAAPAPPAHKATPAAHKR
jgi:exonuclease VII small subunit